MNEKELHNHCTQGKCLEYFNKFVFRTYVKRYYEASIAF